MTSKRLTEINDIMAIAYKLDNNRCLLFDEIDCRESKTLENKLLDLQENIRQLINKSWELYNAYYGDFKTK